MVKTYRILNLGAGVQSSTIALMGAENWHYWHCSEPLPYPAVGLIDFAIFADTQEEPQAVYKHLDWLENQINPIKVLRVSKGKLGNNLIKGVNSDGERVCVDPGFFNDRWRTKRRHWSTRMHPGIQN